MQGVIGLPAVEAHDKVFFVRLDDAASIDALSRRMAYVLTYGMGSKATLTVSSIEDTHMVLCLQRAVTDLCGNVIEPQEFSVSLMGDCDPDFVMLVAGMLLIGGVSVETLSKFVF